MKTFTYAVALAAVVLVRPSSARLAVHPGQEDQPAKRWDRADIKAKLSDLMNRVLPAKALSARQDQCVQDDLYQQLTDSALAVQICREFVQIPPVTSYVQTRPVVIVPSTYTTRTVTQQVVSQVTPFVTVTTTTTVVTNQKREESGADVGGLEKRHAKVLHRIRQAASTTDFDAALTSVCVNCIPNAASTVYKTYTGQPTTRTVLVQQVVATTVIDTVIAPTATTTIVEVQTVPGSPSGSDSVPATPAETGFTAVTTGPAFTCPDDDGVQSTQSIDGKRFTYRTDCGSDIFDPNSIIDDRSLSTLADCVSACSQADGGSDDLPCKAVTFQAPSADGSPNCFFRNSSSLRVRKDSVDSVVVLQVEAIYQVPARADAAFAAASDSSAASVTSAPAPDQTAAGDGFTLSGGSTFSTASTYYSETAQTSTIVTNGSTVIVVASTAYASTTAQTVYHATTTVSSSGTSSSSVSSSGGFANGSDFNTIARGNASSGGLTALTNSTEVSNGPGTFQNVTSIITHLYGNDSALYFLNTVLSGSQYAAGNSSNIQSYINIFVVFYDQQINNQGGSNNQQINNQGGNSGQNNQVQDNSGTTVYQTTIIQSKTYGSTSTSSVPSSSSVTSDNPTTTTTSTITSTSTIFSTATPYPYSNTTTSMTSAGTGTGSTPRSSPTSPPGSGNRTESSSATYSSSSTTSAPYPYLNSTTTTGSTGTGTGTGSLPSSTYTLPPPDNRTETSSTIYSTTTTSIYSPSQYPTLPYYPTPSNTTTSYGTGPITGTGTGPISTPTSTTGPPGDRTGTPSNSMNMTTTSPTLPSSCSCPTVTVGNFTETVTNTVTERSRHCPSKFRNYQPEPYWAARQ